MALLTKLTPKKRMPIADPMTGRVPESITAQEAQRYRMIQNRLKFLMGGLFVLYSFLGMRLAYIAFVPRQINEGAASSSISERGKLLDRNGEVLATQIDMANLIVNPSKVLDPLDAAEKLVRIFPDIDSKSLYKKLSNPEHTYAVLRRDLTPKEQQLVHDLGLPALDFEYSEKRFYPEGNLFAHTLGYVTPDNTGQAGLEMSQNKLLTTKPAKSAPDILGKKPEADPVVLSLDKRIQYVVHEELEKGQTKFNADGIAGLVMDSHTGEIISMVSLPDFDPNYRGGWQYGVSENGVKQLDDRYSNRVTLGTYEMGSTMKVFNTAIALETGAVKLTDSFDVTGPLYYRGHAIKDFHAHRGPLSVSDIFRKSSNIGSVRMADRFGVDVQQQYMRRLGILAKPSLELPEVSGPQIPRQWGYVEMMTMSYGYGISVSPLQLVTGIAAVVNGGIFVQPTLIKKDEEARKAQKRRTIESGQNALPIPPLPMETEEVADDSAQKDKAKRMTVNTSRLERTPPEVGTRIFSEKTSEQMRYLMRLVVEKGGTGTKADVEGYPVIGKTGTANKAKQGHKGYDGTSCISSFVGAFPYQKPQYVILVMVDTPKLADFVTKCPTGGLVAAPVAGQVISRIAPLLGVTPVDPVGDNTFLAGDSRLSDQVLKEDNAAFMEEDTGQ